MRNILGRIWNFFTGSQTPKPGVPPAGCRWRWDIALQDWVPREDPGWHR